MTERQDTITTGKEGEWREIRQKDEVKYVSIPNR